MNTPKLSLAVTSRQSINTNIHAACYPCAQEKAPQEQLTHQQSSTKVEPAKSENPSRLTNCIATRASNWIYKGCKNCNEQKKAKLKSFQPGNDN